MRLVDDESWLAMADSFSAAAVGSASWLDGLSALAQTTGSRAGELIGFGGDNSVPFNWVTDLGPDWVEDFIAAGGGDPQINPFVRAGSQGRVLKVLTSGEFVTREDRRRNPFLAEHVRRHDIPHVCLTPLIKERDLLVGLAVIRSEKQHEIGAEGRAVFESIAPHVRAAARTQMALEHRGAMLVAGALEALSLAVFVCDRRGAVRAMTPEAEALVGEGSALRLSGGELRSTNATESRALTNAVESAAGGLARPGAPTSSTLLLRGRLQHPLALEVVPLPRSEYALGFDPRALVIVRGARPNSARMSTLLCSAYGLTGAEAKVAMRLLDGEAPEAIAGARGTSVGTVRAQIRSIYGKLDVHSLGGMIDRLNRLH